MAGQQIIGFRGVNLRKDRLNLADDEMARAINADFHGQLGAMVLRKGATKQFTTALATTIRRLAKINGCRYQVAGTTLYRNQTSILTTLSANAITTFQGFRPLNDTTLWAFIADDSGMYKDTCSGTALYTWGIIPPATAPTSRVGYTTGLTGDYYGVYTRIRYDGTAVAYESNPSGDSGTLTLAGNDFTLSAMTDGGDPQVNGLGIYHTAAGGSDPLLVTRTAIPTTDGTITVTFGWETSAAQDELLFQHGIPTVDSDGTTELMGTQDWEPFGTGDSEDASGYHATSLWEQSQYSITQSERWAYSDSTGDNALGTSVATNHDRPPTASWVTEHQQHLFLCRDASNPHYLWWSSRYQPEYWPTDQFIPVSSGPDDPLQACISLSGLLIVFSRNTKYRVLGNITSGFVPQEALSRRGTPAPFTVLPTELGGLFLARDGFWSTNAIAADQELSNDIASLWYGDSVADYSPINWDAVETACAAYYKGRIYLALPTGTATEPDILWVWSTDTRKWYAYDLAFRSMLVEEDVDDLACGATDGLVWLLEEGTSDSGSSITLEVQTKDYFGEQLAVRKLFQWLKIDADVPTGTTLSVGMYVDGTLKRTASVSGSRTKVLLPFPEGSMGYQWRAHFDYTGTTAVHVYGAECLWLPLETA